LAGADLDVAEGSFSFALKVIGEAVSTTHGTLDLHHKNLVGKLGSDKLTMPAALDEPFPVETVRSKWKRAKNLENKRPNIESWQGSLPTP
jgi:hypothetical protein